MPALLASGIVSPNRQKIVEGNTLLERAENALDLLRRKVPSAERLGLEGRGIISQLFTE